MSLQPLQQNQETDYSQGLQRRQYKQLKQMYRQTRPVLWLLSAKCISGAGRLHIKLANEKGHTYSNTYIVWFTVSEIIWCDTTADWQKETNQGVLLSCKSFWVYALYSFYGYHYTLHACVSVWMVCRTAVVSLSAIIVNTILYVVTISLHLANNNITHRHFCMRSKATAYKSSPWHILLWWQRSMSKDIYYTKL